MITALHSWWKNEPTRDKNTLDLIATSLPAKVHKVDVIPGISDHDCPLVEIDVSPIRRRQKPREILLYKNAQWDSMAELETVSQETIEEAERSTEILRHW